MNEKLLATLLIGLVAGLAGGFVAATVTIDRGTDASVLAAIQRDMREILQTQKEIQHALERPPSEDRLASPLDDAEPPATGGSQPSIEKLSDSLKSLNAKVDEIRAALVTERIDRIPPDLRVPKQLDRLGDLAATHAADDSAATSRVFGWSPAQVYREFGEPDGVHTADNTQVWWTYVPGNHDPDHEGMWKRIDIVFSEGMAISAHVVLR